MLVTLPVKKENLSKAIRVNFAGEYFVHDKSVKQNNYKYAKNSTKQKITVKIYETNPESISGSPCFFRNGNG